MSRRRDVRLLGALITVSLVALGGAGLALVPGGPVEADPATEARVRAVDESFRQGVEGLKAGRHAEALAAFHRVLLDSPAMPEAHANMGFALLGLGRPREALAFFEGALDLRPAQLNAYWGLAVASEALGDLETARGAMKTYAHLAPAGDPYRRRAEAAIWEWSERSRTP